MNEIQPENIPDINLRMLWQNNCFEVQSKGYKFVYDKNGAKYGLFVDKSKDPEWKDREHIFIFADPTDVTKSTLEIKSLAGVSKSTKPLVCASVLKKINKNENTSIIPAIELLNKSKGYKLYNEITPADVKNYDLVDISTDEMSKQESGGVAAKTPFLMWRPKNIEQKGLKQADENLTKGAQDVIKYLKDTEGWIDKPNAGDEKKYYKCDLANKRPNSTNYCYVETYTNNSGWANYFQGSYILYAPIENFGIDKTKLTYYTNYENALKGVSGATGDTPAKEKQDNCRSLVIAYSDLTKYSRNIVQQEAGRYKEDKKTVEACLINYGWAFPKLSNVVEYLKQPGADKVEFQIANYDYSKKPASERKTPLFGKMKVNESEKLLKNIISENLTKVKQQKDRLLIESTIIENRFNKIVENHKFNNKTNLDKFFNRILIETAYLNSKGYNENVLAEQFEGIFGNLKGFFSGTFFDSIMQYFKEYAVGWLLKAIGIPNKGFMGWVGTFIKTAIGNLPIGELTKLTNCDYAVPFLAKTIVESIIVKFTEWMKFDNAFTSVLRNSIVEMGEDTSFVQSLEKGLESVVCPLIRQLSGKMNTVTNNLTQGSEPTKPSTTNSPSEPGKPDKGMESILNSAENLINSTGNMMKDTSRFTD